MEPLLVDTTSLLRISVDRGWGELDDHGSLVLESLTLFDEVLLDGPSIERNFGALQWIRDIESGVEVIDIAKSEVSAIYSRAILATERISPSPANTDFMRIHMPLHLGLELGYRFFPSTYWEHLRRIVNAPDLVALQEALEAAFGEYVPFSGAAFVAIARLLYYLELQPILGADLLLDPTKSYEHGQPSYALVARSILDVFDQEVRHEFEARKAKWFGRIEPSLSLPLLSNYLVSEAEARGWTLGQMITHVRESREVELFRRGLTDVVAVLRAGDAKALDDVMSALQAAAEVWRHRLGAPPVVRKMEVTLAPPLIEVATSVPVPRLRRRTSAERLLVLIDKLLDRI